MTYTRWTKEYTRATFGIEQEFYAKPDAPIAVRNSTVETVRRSLAAAGIKWVKVVRDGTPSVDVELVFPPATDTPAFWQDYSKVMELCAGLGLGYREGCGMHVHIGTRRTKPATNLDEFWADSKLQAESGTFAPNDTFMQGVDGLMSFHLVKDVVRFYGINQSIIDAAMPQSRADAPQNGMISSMSWVDDDDAFEAAQDLPALKSVIEEYSRQNGAMSWNARPKFHAVNIGCYESGTIEFRQHPATLSTQKARDWVRLVTNAIETSDCYRLTSGDGESQPVSQTIETPEMPYRRGSNVGMLWGASRVEGGATVRQLIALTGMTPENIRARFSEMRSAHGQDAIVTHTQQSYNHRYGDSGGSHDLGGYEVLREYTREISAPADAVIISEDAPINIFHNLPYNVARNFMQGPVTRLRH